MEECNIMTLFLYEKDDVGIKRLTEEELAGDYPYWFEDEEVHKYNSHWSNPKTLKSVSKFIDDLEFDSTQLVFSIYSVKNNKHIGNISLQNIDSFNQSAEMAFLFGDRDYWGKGYAFLASKIIINHGFNHLNLKRLYLGCLEKNTAMCKLSIKLGFLKEGLRRRAIFSGGDFNDVVEYGLLKDEYI